jgi:hypothetical protein
LKKKKKKKMMNRHPRAPGTYEAMSGWS